MQRILGAEKKLWHYSGKSVVLTLQQQQQRNYGLTGTCAFGFPFFPQFAVQDHILSSPPA